MEATADSTLVAAARTGDTAAYGELFERYQARIYNYAYGIAGNSEDARDLAQEAFVRVFEALPRMTGELNFSAYLYRTTHNLAIDMVKGRTRFAPPDLLDTRVEPSLQTDPERVALLEEQQAQTWRAAFELSENHRAILTLRELHELPYQDIADIMDMPRNTVGVLLSRARLRFKEAFRMSSVDIDKLTKECRDMLPLLSAYLDDELDTGKRVHVEDHLELCAFCRLALEEMTEASRSYRALLPLLPPAGLSEAVWTRIGQVWNGAGSEHVAQDTPEATVKEQPAHEPPAHEPLPDDSPVQHTPEWGAEAASSHPLEKAASPKRVRRLLSRPTVLAMSAGAVGLVALGLWLGGVIPGGADESGPGISAPGSIIAPAAGAHSRDNTGESASTTTASTESTSTAGTTSTHPTTTAATTTTSTTTRDSQATPTTEEPTVTPGSPGPPHDPGPTNDQSLPAGSLPSLSTLPRLTVWTRVTLSLDTEPPPTPAVIAPVNGAIVQTAAVVLSWGAVKDPSGVTYRVEVQAFDQNAGAYVRSRAVEGLNATSLAHVMASSMERWRVTAVDGAGNASPRSAWATFSLPPLE